MRAKDLAELPEAELHAMRLDGELWRMPGLAHAAWLPPDASDGPRARAASLAWVESAGGERAIVLGRAGEWVRLGGAPPRLIELGVPRGRGRPPADGISLVERMMPEADVERIGGIRVARPERLLIDAAMSPRRELPEIARLAQGLGVDAATALRRVRQLPRQPGSALARRRLEALERARATRS